MRAQECRRNVDEFLKHPELQKLCRYNILHNVCFIIYEDNALVPFPMSQVPADILREKNISIGALGMAGTVNWEAVENYSQLRTF